MRSTIFGLYPKISSSSLRRAGSNNNFSIRIVSVLASIGASGRRMSMLNSEAHNEQAMRVDKGQTVVLRSSLYPMAIATVGCCSQDEILCFFFSEETLIREFIFRFQRFRRQAASRNPKSDSRKYCWRGTRCHFRLSISKLVPQCSAGPIETSEIVTRNSPLAICNHVARIISIGHKRSDK